MPVTSIFSKRFSELHEQAKVVDSTKVVRDPEYPSIKAVEPETFLSWKVNTRHLIATVCTKDSEHYNQFVECEKPRSFRSSYTEFTELRAVFVAAKEDYERGYLNKFRNLVQADVFGNELEQASELLAGGYKTAAAVVAGVVLETAIRQLCADNQIPAAKLDKMNADLAKAGVYNTLVQKQITAQAGIRNSAAHGKPNDFTDKDVASLIAYTETFLADRL